VPNEQSTYATSGVGPSDLTAEQSHAHVSDDASSSPEHSKSDDKFIDWSDFTFVPDEQLDGDATVLVDEELIYEAMDFRDQDEGIAEGSKQIPVPEIPPEVQAEIEAAAVPVDDNEAAEPMFFYDRDNLEMTVGTLYPSMDEFRLALKQHAVVKDFELGTENLTRADLGVSANQKDAHGLLELKLRGMKVSGYLTNYYLVSMCMPLFTLVICHCLP
jgi:hypothetical protein